MVLDFLAAGSTVEELLAEYPQLVREDVLTAMSFDNARIG